MKQDVINVGVNDRDVDLFEGMYRVPNGVAYNSYVILDDKIAVMDTVDSHFTSQWLGNIKSALGGKTPDYLVVLHMEPDHSANIFEFVKAYPSVQVVGNAKTFAMMSAYFGEAFDKAVGERKVVVTDGGKLSLGKHELTFVFAPMVHWPEVMVAYDAYDKALYSADAFGKFGALDAKEEWIDEARRYYIGIVGKYGIPVQTLLKKAAALDISVIRPLHGPVLTDNLGYYLDLYNKWSSYTPEKSGVLIAYTSVYGNTKKAAELLASELEKLGVEYVIFDLARADRAECVAQAFKYDKAVFATTTYNADIFPPMREFLDCLVERNYKCRKVAIVENGSWAPAAAKVISTKLEKCSDITYIADPVTVKCALNDASAASVKALAQAIAKA